MDVLMDFSWKRKDFSEKCMRFYGSEISLAPCSRRQWEGVYEEGTLFLHFASVGRGTLERGFIETSKIEPM